MAGWLVIESPVFRSWTASDSENAFCLGSKSYNDELLEAYFHSEDVEKFLRGNFDN